MKTSNITETSSPCTKGSNEKTSGTLYSPEYLVFPRIPNIRSMKLEGKVLDPIFLADGIERNIPRKISFTLLNKKDPLNKYINHMERRLVKLRNEKR
jgi:hypothetical protein